MRRPAIIVDIDGTLANIEHRRHHVTGEGKKDWTSFFRAMVNDTPNRWCQELVKTMSITHQIIYVTGRGAEYAGLTLDWLDQHSLATRFLLYTRPMDNSEKDCIIKEAIYREKIEPNYSVTFCVDDRQQVVDMWRSIGLTCLQCDVGDF